MNRDSGAAHRCAVHVASSQLADAWEARVDDATRDACVRHGRDTHAGEEVTAISRAIRRILALIASRPSTRGSGAASRVGHDAVPPSDRPVGARFSRLLPLPRASRARTSAAAANSLHRFAGSRGTPEVSDLEAVRHGVVGRRRVRWRRGEWQRTPSPPAGRSLCPPLRFGGRGRRGGDT
jgi:hypothetical protein